MNEKKHQQISKETIKAVRERAAKHPGNNWAKQIILICGYANEQIHKTSEGKRVEYEGDCGTMGVSPRQISNSE